MISAASSFVSLSHAETTVPALLIASTNVSSYLASGLPDTVKKSKRVLASKFFFLRVSDIHIIIHLSLFLLICFNSDFSSAFFIEI